MAQNSPYAYEGDLNCMISEYLDHIGLVDAKINFEEECRQAKRPIDEGNFFKTLKDEGSSNIQNEMFKLFDAGMRTRFFKTWDNCISADIREGDSWCQKLEFYLNLYFAVYPLKTNSSPDECENSMSYFRDYLETKGAPLSQTPDFLPYYALPFVPSPRSHESFKELFDVHWASDLRIKLETFLYEVLRETTAPNTQPRLIDLYHCNNATAKEVNENLKVSERKLLQTEKKNSSLSKQLIKFQDNYQKLMGVTAELISALEAAVKGDWVDIDLVLNNCSSRFPEIFKPSNDKEKQVIKDSVDPSNSIGMQRFKENLQQQSEKVSLMTSLQFDIIKKDLVGSDLRTKLLLLQALRWRITKTGDREELILNSYITNDILGFEKSSDYRQKILHNIRSPSESLRQSYARMLNVFASYSSGRSYLAQCPQLLAVLIENIVSGDPDQVTLDMTLGTLQKLSLRRKLQTKMIDSNVIDWLITTLEEHVTLSEYSLEYASALLMNLCLRTAGKKSCVRYPRRVLSLLISLLDMGQQHKSIIPYVNGALYSLLSVSAIRSEAVRFGLSKVLEDHMAQSNAEMKRQYEYIMKQLNGNNSNHTENNSDVEEDDDDEEDDSVELDPELDRNDLITKRDNELIGEKLLSAKYVNKKHDIKDALERPVHSNSSKGRGGVLQRLSTPQSNNNSTTNASHKVQNSDSRMSSRNHSLKNEPINKNKLTDVKTRYSPDEVPNRTELNNKVNCSSPKVDLVKIQNPPDILTLSTENFFNDTKKKEISSRPSTANSVFSEDQFNTSPLMGSFKVDKKATDLVSRATGKVTSLVEAEKSVALANHYPGLNSQEYVAVFSTRPRIPRTPDSATNRKSPKQENSDLSLDHSSSPTNFKAILWSSLN